MPDNNEIKAGYRVSGLMRDYLIMAGIDSKRAEQYAEQFNDQIKSADWLETFEGVTFDRGFVPEKCNK